MSYYYLNHANETVGPVGLHEISCLVQGGVLAADVLVCEQGRDNWVPVLSLIEVTENVSPPSLEAPTSPLPRKSRHQAGRLTVTKNTPRWLVWICDSLYSFLGICAGVGGTIYGVILVFKFLFR